MLLMWIVKINKKCVEASKVLLSKISTNVKSNTKCKCKVKYVLLSKISTKVKSTIECKRKVLFTIKN